VYANLVSHVCWVPCAVVFFDKSGKQGLLYRAIKFLIIGKFSSKFTSLNIQTKITLPVENNTTQHNINFPHAKTVGSSYLR